MAIWRWLLLIICLAGPVHAQAPPTEQGFIDAGDGVRLFYRIEGSGPDTLVMVHGGPGFSMESIREDLARLTRGRRIIFYDQRGNGRSSLIDDEERLAISRHIADLDTVRRHFGLERMQLLGNSWGGLLISAYAAAHPDRVERMVLDASAGPRASDFQRLGEEFGRRARIRLSPRERAQLEAAFQPRNWLEARDPVALCRTFARGVFRLYTHDPVRLPPSRADLCGAPVAAVRRSLAVNGAIVRSMGDFDLRPAVRAMTAPVLVIHGESDPVPLDGAREWARAFPDARLLVVPRAGHLIHLEQAEIFFAAVETFLAGAWPEGAQRLAATPR